MSGPKLKEKFYDVRGLMEWIQKDHPDLIKKHFKLRSHNETVLEVNGKKFYYHELIKRINRKAPTHIDRVTSRHFTDANGTILLKDDLVMFRQLIEEQSIPKV